MACTLSKDQLACTLSKDHLAWVKIQSLDDPSTYWLIPNEKEPPSKRIDQVLTKCINARLKPKAEVKARPFLPKQEQMIAVMDPKTHVWHRGKVKTVFLPADEHCSYRYSVFLVDYGMELKVEQMCICKLPEDEIFRKKHHAMQFKLYGIVPCNKQVKPTCEGDFKLVSAIGKDWDPIAMKFVTEKSEVATAIYMTSVKYIDQYVGETIMGDLHFVIGGRCINMVDDLCSNQYAAFDETLFKQQFELLKRVPTMPSKTHNELESAKYSATCNDPIADGISPGSSRGKRLGLVNVKTVGTPGNSSYAFSSPEPILIPGGVIVQNIPKKAAKPLQSQSARQESKTQPVSNSSNFTEPNIAPAPAPNTYPSTSCNRELEQEPPNQCASKSKCSAPNSTSRFSIEKDSTEKNSHLNISSSQATNYISQQLHHLEMLVSPDSVQQSSMERKQTVSPKTYITPELNCTVVTNIPESTDLAPQHVTKRGRRIKAQVLSNANMGGASECNSANESLEVVALNSSLNTSDTGSCTSGLFSKIITAFDQTEATDSNVGLKRIHSPQSSQEESPSSHLTKPRNKFLSLLDDLS